MLGLSAVVALAACGAAIFIVVSVVSIVVWVRYRNKRHALTRLGFPQTSGKRSRGLQSFPVDTLTELSRAEGSVLRAHGQLPYGKPGEWGQLTSRESLLRPKHSSDSSFPFTEKARSIRNSLSRSRSKRLSRSSHKRMSSLPTLGESCDILNPVPKASTSKEDIPLSAVEGVLELPAEITPRQTPDPNESGAGFHLGMRPVSPKEPLQGQQNRSNYFTMSETCDAPQVFDPSPMVIDESPRRLRGTSIVSQTPGIMPDQSLPPPPPTAYPSDRFSYARNDSVMRLSSMSLDTTNSSILDDGRNGPRSADTDLTSSSFPSGGTFVPFSAADVGVKDGRRSFIATNTSVPPMPNVPMRSCSATEPRHKSPSLSPRRSLTTTQNSGASIDRFIGAPRRSDSISSSNPPSRNTSLRSGASIVRVGYQNPNPPDWRFSSSSLVPHFSQYHNNTVYEDDEMEIDPFYVGSPGSGTRFHPVESPPRNTIRTSKSPSPMQSVNLPPKGHLPSALKGGNSQRKGHRRQNCVRISIHPPLTFGSSTFSPTVEEEPEDFDKMEELDLRESTMNSPAKPLPSLPPPNANSPLSSRRSKYGSRHGKPGLGSLGPLVEEPQPPMYDGSPCKRKGSSPILTANKLPTQNDRHLPEIFTCLPPSTGMSLTHTPSPEREPPVWELPEASSPARENCPAIGSSRRSAVKGPRNQPSPIATCSHSTRVSTTSNDHNVDSPLSPSRLPLVMSITGTEGSDWRRSADSLQRTRTDASGGSFRRDRDSMPSLDNGLGPIGSSSALCGNRRSSLVQNRVTIFEDPCHTIAPSRTSMLPPVGSFRTPESSPIRDTNSIPRSLPPKQQLPPHLSSHYAPPTPTSPRRVMATPTGKTLGLGIGAATPVSLYDGDGFLRE